MASNFRLALLAHAHGDGSGQAPLIAKLTEQCGRALLTGGSLASANSAWEQFLYLLARFRVFAGESGLLVVSPNGMLHRRESEEHDSTRCGKSLNASWLKQFYRGAAVSTEFHFGHSHCSRCLSFSSLRNGYEADMQRSFEDYKGIYEQALAITLKEYGRALKGREGARIRSCCPLDDKLTAKVLKSLSEDDWYEIEDLLPEDLSEIAEEFEERVSGRLTEQLMRALAAAAAEIVLGLPSSQIAAGFLGKESELQAIAMKACSGDTTYLPLPDKEHLTEIFAGCTNVWSFDESLLAPLIADEWREALLPAIESRWNPKSTNKYHHPQWLIRAYRIMPGRQPLHTNGSLQLNLKEFSRMVKEQMRAEVINAEALAAELNLDLQALKSAVDAKVQPSLTLFLTVYEWLRDGDTHYDLRVESLTEAVAAA